MNDGRGSLVSCFFYYTSPRLALFKTYPADASVRYLPVSSRFQPIIVETVFKNRTSTSNPRTYERCITLFLRSIEVKWRMHRHALLTWTCSSAAAMPKTLWQITLRARTNSFKLIFRLSWSQRKLSAFMGTCDCYRPDILRKCRLGLLGWEKHSRQRMWKAHYPAITQIWPLCCSTTTLHIIGYSLFQRSSQSQEWLF